MITLTRQGLLLTLSASVIPSQGSSDVPVSVTNDQSTYVGYTLEPRVGYYLNGIYKSIVCVYDPDTKTFYVPAEVFRQNGVIDITLALIDNTNANHIETCQAVHATINKAPLGTVILPDQTTWQEYVNSYMNQLFDTDYKPQFDQIQQNLENLVSEAQQQQQTASNQQTQIDNAISVMGEYQIVSNDPVQIQFKQGDGTYGPTVDLGDGLASKSMVNAGYYQSIGSQYSGAASDYGIQVEEIVGAYVQDGTPTPDAPIEPQFVQIENFYTSGKNLFDLEKAKDLSYWSGGSGYRHFTGIELEPNSIYSLSVSQNNMYKDYNVEYNGNFALYVGETENVASPNKLFGNASTSKTNVLTTYTIRTSDKPFYINLFVKQWNQENLNIVFDELLINLQIEKGSTATAYEPYKSSQTPVSLELMALPNGVADTWKDGTLTHNVASVTFDGSEDEIWSYISSGSTFYISGGYYAKNFSLPLCNKLQYYQFSGVYNMGITVNVYGLICVRLEDETINTVDLFKIWLSQNPITVWYQLATPTTEQLAIPTLQSFYPFTNAWGDSFVQPQITWNVLTGMGRSTVTDALGNPILNVPFATPKQLFVNPDFQVNQRGESSYSVQDLTPTYKYTLDMWYISSATGQAGAAGFGGQAVVNVESDDIEVTLGGDATFGQITNIAYSEYTSVTSLININGNDYVVTISAIPQNNGNTYQKIIQFGNQMLYLIVKNVSGNLEFYLQATSSSSITFTLKYWALYPGNIAYKHVKNDYDVDFLKCARYYINFYGITIKRVAFIGYNLAHITYELPTIMNDSVQPNITETTSMLWQNDDTSQPTTTSLTNAQIEGKMGNAITVGFSGNFGNDNWRVAYCSSVGVEFNAEPNPS